MAAEEFHGVELFLRDSLAKELRKSIAFAEFADIQ